MKKKSQRRRSKIKLVQQAIDRTAQSLERAGINQNRLVIRLGGKRPKRWKRPESERGSMQK